MTPKADDLERFVDAQETVYPQVLAELRRGRKTSHWMWFVFPQLRGLGHSATAQFYGLQSAEEALRYWQHPLLGARLRECTESILAVPGRSAQQIFGSPDDLKLRSCLTLFRSVSTGEALFEQALTRFFDGAPDPMTIELLRASEGPSTDA